MIPTFLHFFYFFSLLFPSLLYLLYLYFLLYYFFFYFYIYYTILYLLSVPLRYPDLLCIKPLTFFSGVNSKRFFVFVFRRVRSQKSAKKLHTSALFSLALAWAVPASSEWVVKGNARFLLRCVSRFPTFQHSPTPSLQPKQLLNILPLLRLSFPPPFHVVWCVAHLWVFLTGNTALVLAGVCSGHLQPLPEDDLHLCVWKIPSSLQRFFYHFC